MLRVPAESWLCPLVDLKQHYSSMPFPYLLWERKKEEMCFSGKALIRVCFTCQWEDLCVYLFISQFTVVLFPWMFYLTIQITFFGYRSDSDCFPHCREETRIRDPFSKTAPVCTIFLCWDLHLSDYYYFLKWLFSYAFCQWVGYQRKLLSDEARTCLSNNAALNRASC